MNGLGNSGGGGGGGILIGGGFILNCDNGLPGDPSLNGLPGDGGLFFDFGLGGDSGLRIEKILFGLAGLLGLDSEKILSILAGLFGEYKLFAELTEGDLGLCCLNVLDADLVEPNIESKTLSCFTTGLCL